MNKKAYQLPAMRVVEVAHRQMLCGSPAANGVSLPGGEGISWTPEGIGGDDY